eukprot:TRINITY_DN18976_c0_g3_i1.p1 TRINITY_DN18976_c0_g3~~TRINITY_DN18976_c0_g3_i1.p1  ORF type:complete len:532 (-),score=73.98 TRINITY_DN18976_c0_g3_i1:50-1645(-)
MGNGNLSDLLGAVSELVEVQRALKHETQSRWCDFDERANVIMESIRQMQSEHPGSWDKPVELASEPLVEDPIHASVTDTAIICAESAKSHVSVDELDIEPQNKHHAKRLEVVSHVVLSAGAGRSHGELSTGSRNRLALIVHSVFFEAVANTVLLVHVIVGVVTVQLKGRALNERIENGCLPSSCRGDDARLEAVFGEFNAIVCTIYVVEIVLRITADSFSFFQEAFNIFDLFTVCLSVMEECFTRFLDGTPAGFNVSLLRLARLAKIGKAFRTLKIMKAVRPLRILLKTLTFTIGSFTWSAALICGILLAVSSVFSTLAMSEIIDGHGDIASKELLNDHFGTWSTSLESLFEITMVAGAFMRYRSLSGVAPTFWWLILLYVVLVTFLVMRTVTSLFLRLAFVAAQHESLAQSKKYIQIFESLEVNQGDDSHAVSFDCVSRLVEDPLMQQMLADIGVNGSDALRLFALRYGNGIGQLHDWLNDVVYLSAPVPNASAVLMCRQLDAICSILMGEKLLTSPHKLTTFDGAPSSK